MRITITPLGKKKLEDELKRLKTVERPAVIEAIAEARGHGDLSENAEYDAAREKQGLIEGRIQELESMLADANVIDISRLAGDKVMFGATVTIVDENTDEEKTYTIVSEVESDLSQGLISNTSPLGRALIGKEVGDQVEVNAPSGLKYFEILEVKYSSH